MRKLILPLLLAASLSCSAVEWKPVTPEELSGQKPKVDPSAAAEALFTETWVVNELVNGSEAQTVYTHYIRLKIFTEAGVNRYGTVNLDYSGKANIIEIAARTIEPDGTIVEMKRDAIFNHAVAKRKHLNWRAVSFAMPGVKVGAILEYRWREIYPNQIQSYVFLEGGREFPVQRAIFHIKPLDSRYTSYEMRGRALNAELGPIQHEANGFATTELTNIPALADEEDSPPETDIEPTILIFYAENRKETPDHFWKSEGKERYNAYKSDLKINSEVKQIAAEATADAKTDEEKLSRLVMYCRKNIKDVTGPDVSDIDRKNFKENRTTAETLSRRIGTSRDIDLAFTALAIAAGYDARLAFLTDRQQLIFRPALMIPYLPERDVAVQVNGKWKLYDVSDRNLPVGSLPWYQEGTEALVVGGKDSELIPVEFTPADKSKIKRTGRLKLQEDGSVEGDLTFTLTGHPAADWRATYVNHSAAEREKQFEDEMKRRVPGAEITSVKMSDPADVTTAFSIEFHLKCDTYATRTGKRLFFSPAFFQLNEPARYTASTRKYDLLFRYPWSEQDDVSVTLPKGYELDHPDAPGNLPFPPIGNYSVRIMRIQDRILLHREFVFGKTGEIYFGSANYATLKQIFDHVHTSDAHMLTLKAATATASAEGSRPDAPK